MGWVCRTCLRRTFGCNSLIRGTFALSLAYLASAWGMNPGQLRPNCGKQKGLQRCKPLNISLRRKDLNFDLRVISPRSATLLHPATEAIILTHSSHCVNPLRLNCLGLRGTQPPNRSCASICVTLKSRRQVQCGWPETRARCCRMRDTIGIAKATIAMMSKVQLIGRRKKIVQSLS